MIIYYHDYSSTPPVLQQIIIPLPQTLLWLLDFDASGVLIPLNSSTNKCV